MSGFLVIRHEDGVSILTDGGRYQGLDDLTLAGFGTKTIVMPHINAAIVFSGSAFFPSVLKYRAEIRWTSFDAMISGLEDDAWTVGRALTDWYPGQQWGAHRLHCYMVVAGYSDERDRWESFQIAVLMGHEDEDAVDGPHPAPNCVFKPAPDAESLARYGFDPSNIQIQPGTDDAIRFMRAMRASPVTMGDQDGDTTGHILGGFINQVSLFRDMALSRIVWRWPDKPGELIDPSNEGAEVGETIEYRQVRTEP